MFESPSREYDEVLGAFHQKTEKEIRCENISLRSQAFSA